MTGATVFLANIPSPDRGVWEIGPIPIRAYAIFIIIGIIVAIWWGEKRLQARGGRPGEVVDIAVYAVPFGLIGGRLYHVITDYHRYFGEGKNPIDALKIWEGGLGIWGAIALGAVGAWLGAKRKGIPLPVFADAVAPGIVTAQAIGRIGNYFNQELYGGPTTLPWGLEIYQRVNPNTGIADQLSGVAVDHTPIAIVHPTFLYELLWNLAVALLVVYVDKKMRLGHGRAFALYVAGYTLGRTWIELMRTDDATLVFGVRVNVWVSILVFIGAVVYFIMGRSKGEREDLALLRGDGTPQDPAPIEVSDDAEEEAEASDTDDEDTDGKKDDEKTAKVPVAAVEAKDGDEAVKKDEPEAEPKKD
ncbi:prolipoprotein diacylglyceryl transferase [Kibdelosporangium phytohabitans]|uniref:Phosphatidylglycerol--prolipoprotein diacylglyceryl transferase n=1 Tax=Kibdelosporangium phytohabitans TaxID=860235 RepID=A0A0N9I2C6_9PSEU|nr:prolipoprotein diacylglyceryl transferase [Kibdelosporangium phytohabitans]ALG12789.1 prolipoprotein diacylglyceryl transferase [Kibdelosporangium phytohabitans]MBE1464467.1 prolipoprotein diacylglyceryl transferase [Kibdelosporangium phytohabitans]